MERLFELAKLHKGGHISRHQFEEEAAHLFVANKLNDQDIDKLVEAILYYMEDDE